MTTGQVNEKLIKQLDNEYGPEHEYENLSDE